ncbi:MAG: HDIG domain-containing protein [bacterium]|nr:HDIG domain-containing protein [bacterium]
MRQEGAEPSVVERVIKRSDIVRPHRGGLQHRPIHYRQNQYEGLSTQDTPPLERNTPKKPLETPMSVQLKYEGNINTKTNEHDHIEQQRLALEDLGKGLWLNSEYVQHSIRVSEMMVLLAKELGIPTDGLTMLYLKFGAFYHDIGKSNCIGLMLLPTILTEEQKKVSHKHPEDGARMIPYDMPILTEIIRTHHCDPEGGYPDNRFDSDVLSSIDLPAGRLLAQWGLGILDVLDAMWSSRPYREQPLNLLESIHELIRYKGKEFDSELVELLLADDNKIIQKLHELHSGSSDHKGLYQIHTQYEHGRDKKSRTHSCEEFGYETKISVGGTKVIDTNGAVVLEPTLYKLRYFRDTFSPDSGLMLDPLV